MQRTNTRCIRRQHPPESSCDGTVGHSFDCMVKSETEDCLYCVAHFIRTSVHRVKPIANSLRCNLRLRRVFDLSTKQAPL